ncbi:MAG: OmpA family protein [Acidobacteriota bacterium]|nr:OmpA family protein [Acidobacteriota bacterium]
MSRKKKAEGHVNHERWLISYGDFITLLFALFVVLFASSQVDNRKTRQVALSIQAAFEQLGIFTNGSGHTVTSKVTMVARSSRSMSLPLAEEEMNRLRGPTYVKHELKDIRQQLEATLGPEISRHEVNIVTNRSGLVVSLQEVGFFDSGSAVMKPSAMPVLSTIAAILAPATQKVRVEGHTDNVPIHNAQFASNWELSTARATEVLELLINRFKIAPSRLSAAGYAKYHPAVSNATAAGRARNRRVDIVVLRTDVSQQLQSASSGAGKSPASGAQASH